MNKQFLDILLGKMPIEGIFGFKRAVAKSIPEYLALNPAITSSEMQMCVKYLRTNTTHLRDIYYLCLSSCTPDNNPYINENKSFLADSLRERIIKHFRSHGEQSDFILCLANKGEDRLALGKSSWIYYCEESRLDEFIRQHTKIVKRTLSVGLDF